jgi:hypothetical protein
MTKPDVLVERLTAPTQTEWGSSRWATLERCPREYSFVYSNRIYPDGEPRKGRAIGSAIHRGLAAEYTRQLALINGDSSVPEDLWRIVINAGQDDEMVKAEAVRIVKAHNAYWDTGWRDPMWAEPIAVEKFVRVVIAPIRKSLPDAVFTTRIDLVAKKKKGQIIPVDHKSASKDGDSSIEFGMSGQFLGMLAGWPKGYGKRPGFVMVNKLVKTNVPKFERIPIPFTDRMIEQWKRDMAHLGADLIRYEKEKYFPRHRASCIGRFGACDFYGLCHAGAGASSSYRIPEGTDIAKVIK